MSKKRITIITLISSVLHMLLLAGFGLIYNQKILQEYGSSVNGLISTLSQFVSLFAVLEGGFSTAALVAVYQPIVDGDKSRLNSILLTAKNYLFRLGVIIFVLSFVLGLVYLFFIHSPLTWMQTISLLLITVFTTSFSIAFHSKYHVVLNGFNKQYILNLVSIFTKTLCWIAAVVMILQGRSIVLVYFVYTTNIVLSCILYRGYVKKKLPDISYIGNYDKGLIKGTDDVFVQKIASTVFTSTDLVLISVGVGLANASVYNVYHQIFQMVYALQSSVSESPFNSFGHLINEKRSKFYEVFYSYSILIVISTTILLSAVGSVIVDFIHLYTHGVNDVNYIVPAVALLFYSQYFFMICNKPFGLLLNLEKNFKEQNFQCVLGAVLNLACSIAGMIVWGIDGIILGSVIGAATIMVFNFMKCTRIGHIHKPALICALMIVNYIIGLVCIMGRLYIQELFSGTYAMWILNSVINFLGIGLVVTLIDALIIRKDLRNVWGLLRSFLRRRPD